jgi:hypothetical protein
MGGVAALDSSGETHRECKAGQVTVVAIDFLVMWILVKPRFETLLPETACHFLGQNTLAKWTSDACLSPEYSKRTLLEGRLS